MDQDKNSRMDRPSWDEMYMNMCYEVASRSPDDSTRSGCYIVNTDNTPISFGYNGPPRGIELIPSMLERPLKYKYFEHAERNAIYNATREGKSCMGAKIYINWMPCSDCARGLIQVGIKEVIVHRLGQEAFNISRDDSVWESDQPVVKYMFEKAGVTFRWFDGEIRRGLYGMWSGKFYKFIGDEAIEVR